MFKESLNRLKILCFNASLVYKISIIFLKTSWLKVSFAFKTFFDSLDTVGLQNSVKLSCHDRLEICANASMVPKIYFIRIEILRHKLVLVFKAYIYSSQIFWLNPSTVFIASLDRLEMFCPTSSIMSRISFNWLEILWFKVSLAFKTSPDSLGTNWGNSYSRALLSYMDTLIISCRHWNYSFHQGFLMFPSTRYLGIFWDQEGDELLKTSSEEG